jgi:hypothetical protein
MRVKRQVAGIALEGGVKHIAFTRATDGPWGVSLATETFGAQVEKKPAESRLQPGLAAPQSSAGV